MFFDELTEHYIKTIEDNLDEITRISKGLREQAKKDQLIFYESISYYLDHLVENIEKTIDEMENQH